MTLTAPAPAEALRDATDADSLLHTALVASLHATGAQRGLVVLADLGTGRVYAVQSVGLLGDELDRQRPVLLGGPRHPVAEALRDGEFRHISPNSVARGPLARLGRLGLRAATIVPLPLEVTVSPCLVAGRWPEKGWPVPGPTPSRPPDRGGAGERPPQIPSHPP